MPDLFAPYYLAVYEYVDMGTNIALLSDDTIAKADMFLPQQVQRLSHGSGRTLKRYFRLTVREFDQVTRNLICHHG